MGKKIIIFFTLVFLALLVITVGNVGSKSLYTIAAINANPTPIEAYNIEANGSLTFQAGYGVPYAGWGAVGLGIDSDSATLFVTYEQSNTIQLLDATTMADLGTTTAPGASNLAGIVMDQDKSLLYTVDRSTDDLYIYHWYSSNTTLVLKSTQNLADAPSSFGIALDETNDILYVANYYSSVMYYDTDNWAKLGEFTVSHQLQSIAVDVANQLVYTGGAWAGSNLLTRYDLDTGIETTKAVGTGVMGMAVDPATKLLYCNIGYGSGSLSTIRVFDSDLNELYSTYFDYFSPSPTGLCIPGKDISYNPLNLTKNDGLEEEECINPGEDINYTICFDNGLNQFDIHNVTLEDTLPGNVSFKSASDGGTYDGVNHTVTWDLGTILSGEGNCIWLLVTVDPSTPPETIITNYVTIDSDETPPITQSETTITCNLTGDITPPIQTIEIGNPLMEDVYYTGLEWLDMIGTKTPVWINSSDAESGTDYIKYKVFYSTEFGNWSDPPVWTYVYDNQQDSSPFLTDTDPENGSISICFSFDVSCFHEIHAHCVNNDGLWNQSTPIDFLVDADAPSNEEYSYINSHLLEGGARFISNKTIKRIYVNDTGCSGSVAGVEKIIWRLENNLTQTISNGTVYDNDTEGYEDDYIKVSKDLDTEYGKMIIEILIKEECRHFIFHNAVDYLNNYNDGIKQQVYVDLTPPKINKTVGNPNCTLIPEKEYCITTETPITICAEDLGCWGGVGVDILKYRIWNETHGWAEWEDIESDCGTYYFTEECKHFLEIYASDFLGNFITDNETFYVDDTTPVIDKTVGNPNCAEPQDVDYLVTTSTPIYVNVSDAGCCSNLTVEISEDAINWTIVPYNYIHYFTEECYHELYIKAYDCIGHIEWDNETFYVDDYAPVINKTVGNPNCPNPPGADYCVTTQTPIDINVSGGCSPEFIVEISEDGENWAEITVPYTFNFKQECFHELYIRTYDCLGRYSYDNETFYVDDTTPVIDKTVGNPNCAETQDVDYVVTTSTPIYVNVSDGGCCPNLTVEISEDAINWTIVPDHYIHYFTEECYHELYIKAYDCLGHIDWDNETFYVDDYAPVINKTVGNPNCPNPPGADYCVTTQTPIDINVSGGCSPSFVVEISEDGENWAEITVPYTFNFKQECFHELYIRTYDCLGRYSYDNETFYVDDTTPVIDKTVGTPNCTEPKDVDYVVTTSTPIYVNVSDPGCCSNLTVEISEDAINWTIVPDHYIHYFTEECYHELYIKAYDCLGHIDWDNETFYVDDYAPVINKTVGNPNCSSPSGADYCVTTQTPIDINVSGGCSPSFVVEISEDGENWAEITVPYTFNFKQECFHELYIRTYDCLGRYSYDNETFYVDDTPPKFTKTVGMPSCWLGKDKYGHDIYGCLTTDTEINITAEDQGCCPLPVYITYRISVLGYWSDWITYTGSFTFKEGCDHWLEINVSDCLGNYVLDNETFIVHGPNGPHIEIISPEDDEILNSRDDKYAHVKINGYYGDDPNDHNIIVTLWLDNPYGAPDQYYPVEWNNSEDCFTAEVDIYKYSTNSVLQLVAKGEDMFGGRDYDDVSFEVNTTIDFDKWMETGWNGPINIAVPVCDNSVESVFASIEGDYEWIFEVGTWKNYHYGSGGNSLQVIDPSKWYWIKMNKATRYYIDSNQPYIDITYPEDEAILFTLHEINGTAYDIETSIKNVTVQISYKDESNVTHYWDGMAWVLDSNYLPCVLGEGYVQDWTFNSVGVSWIPGETFYVEARATDKFGCYADDMVSFEFEECICAPNISLEKQVWMGDGWTNETDVFVGENASFNITIQNNGVTIGGKGGGGSGELPINETIIAAIEDGIAWLVTQQSGDGSWGSYKEATTAFVLIKLQDYAYETGYSPFDPDYDYYSNVIAGWEYLFDNCNTLSLTVQTNGDPDTNGNGIGLYWHTSRTVYSTGICAMALSASGVPDRENDAGIDFNSDGDPDTFGEISQDTVDWLAYAQSDSGSLRGGWYYNALNNQGGGDNSITGYAVLGLAAAEEFGSTVPNFVRSEHDLFIDYIQCDTPGSTFGGSGYSQPCSWVNMLKTGNLIFEMTFYGDGSSDSRFVDALDYIENHFHDENLAPGWGYKQNAPAHYQAMYCLMKGLEYSGIDLIDLDGDDTPEHDWYTDFADLLIDHQQASGSWPSSPAYVWEGGGFGYMSGEVLSTCWALLTLEKIAPEIVTDCPPCNLTDWYINDTLPAGLEYVENSTKIVVVGCNGLFESSDPEVQPEVTYNADGTTTLEWWETGEEPFELSLCTTMYVYFNATVLNCVAPDGHINMAYVEAYSPDDETWVSDEGMATVWGDCV